MKSLSLLKTFILGLGFVTLMACSGNESGSNQGLVPPTDPIDPPVTGEGLGGGEVITFPTGSGLPNDIFDTGNSGQDGADGSDGDGGSDGKDGADGSGGSNGNDGGDGKDGKDGQDGANGADGQDGSAGVSEGGQCDTGHPCGPGLVCYGQGTCIKGGLSGAQCDEDHPCALGLSCESPGMCADVNDPTNNPEWVNTILNPQLVLIPFGVNPQTDGATSGENAQSVPTSGDDNTSDDDAQLPVGQGGSTTEELGYDSKTAKSSPYEYKIYRNEEGYAEVLVTDVHLNKTGNPIASTVTIGGDMKFTQVLNKTTGDTWIFFVDDQKQIRNLIIDKDEPISNEIDKIGVLKETGNKAGEQPYYGGLRAHFNDELGHIYLVAGREDGFDQYGSEKTPVAYYDVFVWDYDGSKQETPFNVQPSRRISSSTRMMGELSLVQSPTSSFVWLFGRDEDDFLVQFSFQDGKSETHDVWSDNDGRKLTRYQRGTVWLDSTPTVTYNPANGRVEIEALISYSRKLYPNLPKKCGNIYCKDGWARWYWDPSTKWGNPIYISNYQNHVYDEEVDESDWIQAKNQYEADNSLYTVVVSGHQTFLGYYYEPAAAQ